jgi:hypothetical protein
MLPREKALFSEQRTLVNEPRTPLLSPYNCARLHAGTLHRTNVCPSFIPREKELFQGKSRFVTRRCFPQASSASSRVRAHTFDYLALISLVYAINALHLFIFIYPSA